MNWSHQRTFNLLAHSTILSFVCRSSVTLHTVVKANKNDDDHKHYSTRSALERTRDNCNNDDGNHSSANDDYCNLEESSDYDRANDDSRKDSSDHGDDGCI